MFTADGDIAQSQILSSDPDVKQVSQAMRLTTFKHHRTMSFLFSANDTWKTGHKKLKAQLRTGTVAEFSDARVLRAAEAAYALERTRIKLAYPKCTIPKKLPEKVAQMITALQPCLRDTAGDNYRLEAFKLSGLDMRNERLQIDPIMLMRGFPTLSKMTPQEMKAYQSALDSLREEVSMYDKDTSVYLQSSSGMKTVTSISCGFVPRVNR